MIISDLRKKLTMFASIIVLVPLAILAAAAFAGAVVITLRDGYRRVPTNR
jgi:hypothetical protein